MELQCHWEETDGKNFEDQERGRNSGFLPVINLQIYGRYFRRSHRVSSLWLSVYNCVQEVQIDSSDFNNENLALNLP